MAYRRQNSFANDTSTDLVGLDITGLDNVRAFLDGVADSAGLMADNVVSKTAAGARKVASRAEESQLTLGKGNRKYVSGKGWIGGGSQWDSALGGYKSYRKHKNGKGLRLINFKYENLAGPYKTPISNVFGLSSLHMTSQVANLWENDAYYTKRSSVWMNASGGYSSWKKGTRRPGKHYFTGAFTSAVSTAVPKAKVEAEAKFLADVARLNGKQARQIRNAARKLGGTP